MKSYFAAWRKSFDFKGRSTRREYWIFFLIDTILFPIVFTTLNILQNSLTGLSYSYDSNALNSSVWIYAKQIISILSFLLLPISLRHTWTLLPLTVRRIRDVGMKWQWIFFVSIPLLGFIFVLIFLTRTSVVDIDDKQYFRKY